MYVLYDTRTVPPPDRFEYARAGSASELAPMALRGRAPGRLLAVMSVAQIGDFVIEAETWAADSELAGHRTDRLIRACDPECYRIYLSVNGGVRVEQADSQIAFRARDIALYDMSCPAVATHPTGPVPMQVVTLSFPRALVPVTRAAIRPLLGTVMPRNLPGRSLIAELLTGLTGLAGTATTAGQEADPHLADVLRECTAGLIRQWLGQPDGVTRARGSYCAPRASAPSSASTSVTPGSARTRSPGPPISRRATCTSYSRTPKSRRCSWSSSCAWKHAAAAWKTQP